MTDTNGPAESASAATVPAPSREDRRRRRLLRWALPGAVVAGALGLTLVAVLDDDEPVKVRPPKPPFDAVKQGCEALHKELPGDVLGHGERKTVPDSKLTAAWGDPAIVLRCGVPKPESLRADGPAYNPTQTAVGVNGVTWVFEPLGPGKGVRLTTADGDVHVEVTVPAGYAEPGGVVTAFADPIKKALPAVAGGAG